MTERERLVKLLDQSPAHFCDGCKEAPEERAEAIEKLADYLLAADAVEVVRCKDCKKCESYYPSKKEGEEPYPLVYECKRNRECVLPTHFCAYGERREG